MHRAATPQPFGRIVAVCRGDVPLRERRERVVSTGNDVRRICLVLAHRVLYRLVDQLLAVGEVLVEAAVREPGGAHDLRNARRFGPAFPDPFRRDADDPLVALGLVVFRVAHDLQMIDVIHIC